MYAVKQIKVSLTSFKSCAGTRATTATGCQGVPHDVNPVCEK